MIKPYPNQRRIAWRLGVCSFLIFIVLVLTAVIPLIAQDASSESIHVQPFKKQSIKSEDA